MIHLKPRSKTIIALALVIALLLPIFSNIAIGASEFADMPNDWSTEALNHAISNDLLNGYIENGIKLIKPRGLLLRNEMYTVITRAFGAKVLADLDGVKDVLVGSWYEEYMAKALQMDILDKTALMYPTRPATREEVFSSLARAFQLKTEGDLQALDRFTDKSSVSLSLRPYIDAMVKEGYLEGYPDGSLKPKANITRAEFATVMYRMIGQYLFTPITYRQSRIIEEGNVLIRASRVNIRDANINGDLIIADGVGDGNVILTNVNIEGRLVIRGGGVNSIIIRGNSQVGTVVLSKKDSSVRVVLEDNADVEVIYIDDGSDDVILTGNISNLEILAPDITVFAKDANIDKVSITGASSVLEVEKESLVKEVLVSGPSVVIKGQGSVSEVSVLENGDNSLIETPRTKINTDKSVSGVKGAGNTSVPANSSYQNNSAGTSSSFVPPAGGFIPPTPIYINLTAVNISGKPEKEKVLTATVDPQGASVNYQWLSSPSENGVYEEIVGATNSNYTLKEEDVGKYIKVRVTANIPYMGTLTSSATDKISPILVTAIEVTGDEQMWIGDSIQLTANISPPVAFDKEVTWSSEDETIASVTQDGLVTGLKGGQVNIVATSKDGRINGRKEITVVDNIVEYMNMTFDLLSNTILSYDGQYLELDIPSKIQGYDVLHIADQAFMGNRDLRRVSLPSGLISIGKKAFFNCDNLIYVRLYENVIIDDQAFNEFQGLRNTYELVNGGAGIYARKSDYYWAKENIWYDLDDIAFEDALIYIPLGHGRDISLTFIPQNASSLLASWEIDDPLVASLDLSQKVSGNIFVTGLSLGHTTLRAKALDGDYEAFVEIIAYEAIEKDGFIFNPINNTIERYVGNERRLVVPSDIEGHEVLSISENAFKEGVIAIVLPDSLESLDLRAFSSIDNSESFASIRMPEDLDFSEAEANYPSSLILAYEDNDFKAGYYMRNNSMSDWYYVADDNFVGANLVTLVEESIRVALGTSYSVSASLEPLNASSQRLVWDFLDTDIAKLSGFNELYTDVLIQALELGNVDIKVYSSDGLVFKTLSIEVYEAVEIGDYLFDMGSSSILKYLGNESILNLPNQLNGNPVLAIDKLAFYGNDTINRLKIPNSISTIGDRAFYGVDNLTVLDLPANLLLGNELFSSFEDNLKDVYEANMLLGSEEGIYVRDALNNWEKLAGPFVPVTALDLKDTYYLGLGKTIEIFPDFGPLNASVKIVKNSIEENGVAQLNLIIGDKVALKGLKEGRTEVTMLSLDGSNVEASFDLIVYTPLREDSFFLNPLTKTIVDYEGDDKEVVVPASIEGVGVLHIADGALLQNPNITRLILPSSVLSIGSNQVLGPSNLIYVELPDNVDIADNFIDGNNDFRQVYEANNMLGGIYGKKFDGGLHIWERLDKWTDIESLDILPSSLSLALGQEYELSILVLPPDASWPYVSWEIQDELTVEKISSTDLSLTIKGLKEGATNVIARSIDGDFLASITITVYEAFHDASFIFNQSNNTLVKYIGGENTVVIPNKINNIEVLAIEGQAFYGQSNIFYLELPANLILGDNLFGDNSNALKDTYLANNKLAGIYFSNDGITWDYVDSLDFVHANSVNLQTNTLYIPKGSHKFVLANINPVNASVRLLEWDTEIEDKAKIADRSFDESLIYIEGLLEGQINYEVSSKMNPNITSVLEVHVYEAFNHQDILFNTVTASVDGYVGDEVELTIPPTISGLEVKSIGFGAFSNNTNLTSLVLPDSVTTIEDLAFYGLNSLRFITLTNDVNLGDKLFLDPDLNGFKVFYEGRGLVEGTYEFVESGWTLTE